MERFFRRLGLFIVNRRGVIIIVALVLIAVTGFGATRLTIATGTETWVSTNSQTYKDFQRFSEHFGGSQIVVMVTGDSISQLLQPENIKAMGNVESRLGANPKVISAIAPTFLMTMAIAQRTGILSLPSDPQELQAIIMDPQSNQIRPEFKTCFPDDKHALIPIVLKGGMSKTEERAIVKETEEAVAAAGFVGVEPVVTGEPALVSQLADLVTNSLRTTMIFAVVLMFLIITLMFGVRGFFAWRWLPLGIVGIGIIYTFGAMGLLSVPISMISMAVFPILFGLGIDYAINLQNRYDEETKRFKSPIDALIASVTHVGPAIGIALITECLGFSGLFFSPVPMIRDFGRVLIIGVVICYIVAIFVPLLILRWRDRHAVEESPATNTANRQTSEGLGIVEKGLQRLAPWVIKNPVIIITIALGLAVAGLVADHHIKTETDTKKFISEDVPVIENLFTLEKLAGGFASLNVLVEARDVTEPEVLSWMIQLERRIGTEMADNVGSTSCIGDFVLDATDGEIPQSSEQVKQCLEMLPKPLTRNLISDDLSAANIIVNFKKYDVGRVAQFRVQLADYITNPPAGVNATVTGNAAIEGDMFQGMGGGRLKITLVGVGLVFLSLFILFRFSPLKAFISGLPVVLVIAWSSGIMYVSGIKYNPLTICLGALIMGIGVEYTILYMMRYYEERGKGEGPSEAMTTAVTKVGRAIMVSGLTTIGGFSALLAAGSFLIVRDFGLVTLIAVFLGLVSAVIVHPPLVVWVDSWLDRRRLAKVRDTSDGNSPV